MPKQVYEKMGIKPGDKVALIDAPRDAVSQIVFPGLNISEKLTGQFDHVILFVKTQNEMRTSFEPLKSYINNTGKLWVAWPKARKLGSDLNIPSVIKIGYTAGMVESTNLSVNETWTALKFTWPKPGKTYNNSYGKLPDMTGPQT